MGIKRWRKVFAEVNCLENLSDEPADWKSDEACTLCNSDAQQSEENREQTANVLSDQTSSDRASPSGQATSNGVDPNQAAFCAFTSSLPANAPQLSDYLDHNNNDERCTNRSFASLLKLTSMTSTPMMTNTSNLIADSEPLNSLNSLNSFNNLISTTESMAANQNGSNADFPDVKVVSILVRSNFV